MSVFTEMIERAATALARKRANALDDILAGLLINGVSRDDIEVQEYPGSRIVVAVRGVPRYEITAKFSIKSVLGAGRDD